MTDELTVRAITPGELRDDFMNACRILVDYWAGPEANRTTVHERLSGLAHSLLCVIDGASSSFPYAIDLTASPHPDDKEFCQSEGDNWVEPGTVFNASDMLHELLYGRGIWEGRPLNQGGKVTRAVSGLPVRVALR